MKRKPFKSVAEMITELESWTPSWGNQLPTRSLIYACAKLDEIADLLAKRKHSKRKPSAYMKFAQQRMKAGKSLVEISREWKDR